MKKYLILLVLTVCISLSGCKGKNSTVDAAPPEQQEEQEIGSSEKVSEPAESEPEIEPLRFTVDDTEKRINLVDCSEFAFDFYAYRDLSDGYYDYSYILTNKKAGNEITKIELFDIYINGDISIGSDLADYTYKNDNKITANRISSYIYTNDIDCVTAIRGSVRAYYADGSTVDGEYDFDVKIDPEGAEEYDLQPFMGAMAVTQYICSDDSMEAELIGFGSFNGNDGSLKGLLRIKNLTDENKLFAVNTCVINNVCFECGYDMTLPPKTEQYFDFHILDSDIMRSGITSISSVKLLILSSESENKSISGEHAMGGRLYDVELCKKGNDTTPSTSGEEIYNANGVKVYLTGGKADETTYGTDIYCYVTVINDTDDNISFSYSDTKANGVDCDRGGFLTWRMDLSYVNSSTIDNVIPSGCRKDETIMFYQVEDLKFPCKCICKLDFMSAGGGELLFRSDDVEFTFDGIAE